uniref:Transcription elongation factor n=1 Tax=Panagrolaimus superbus TaxID=310955 RepID=A0A914ZAZ2_9BILA
MEIEIAPIATKLEKMSSGDKSMDGAPELIAALEKAEISADVLSKTRIGLILNDFRKKTTDEKLAKRAKQLIKNWKSKVEAAASAKPARIDSESRKKSSTTASPLELPEAKRPKLEMNDIKAKPEPSTSIKIPPRLRKPEDPARERNVTIISKSLTSGPLPDGSLNADDVALQIEAAIYELHGDGEKYTSTIRSRVFNLRDKKNPDLRENIIVGSVSPSKFAKMSADEMASSDMKKLRDSFTKEAINEHQMSVQEGTPTDMFKCGKCLKWNCTYSQVQTRSADEPMTTFVFCRECGN